MTAPLPEFTDLVRDALLHVYDVGYLQAHPLRALVDVQEAGVATGSRLRQALLDAIETLRPGPDVAPTARAWRLHHILELRYIECHTAAEVMDQVALSSAQYHREHQRALQMVAVVLWEQWHALERWAVVTGDERARHLGDADPIRREAEGLMHERQGERVDLAQVAQDLHLLLQSLCAGRTVDLHLTVAQHLPPIVGERVAARQLFLVLLFHAVNAVEQGSITIELANQPLQVMVTISGPAPTAPDQLELGIRESRPFVEALHGTISYELAGERKPRWQIQVSLPSHARPSLLVVDNNDDFIRLIELYLTGSDWEIISAGTVEEAARYARQRHPNVILLDVIIPGRDGWELLLELRNHSSTQAIPVIICSVLNEPQMATALGASAYLPKPVTQSQLLAMLRPYH